MSIFKTIDKVCELVTDGTHYTPPDIGKGIPFLTVKDMSTKGLDFINSSKISEIEYQKALNGNSAPQLGDVLFSKDGTVGKVHVVKENISFAVLSSIAILRPNSQILDSNYFGHVLQFPQTLDQASRRKTGSALRRIILKDLKKVKIPLPALPEQKRIAAILDKADALRQKRRATLAKLDTLLQSVFLDMFGDPVTNPKGWQMGKVGDLATQVNYGTSKKADQRGQFPILRMGNITYEGRWDFSDLKYIDLDEKEQGKHLVYKGQILFNRTNSKDLVGKTALYREEKPMAFAGYLVRMVTNEKANPEYVAAFMNTPHTKTWLKEKCKNIVGMANINAREFQAIKLPIPPIELQNQFAGFVQQVSLIRDKQIKNISILNNLFHALQQRAFKGAL